MRVVVALALSFGSLCWTSAATAPASAQSFRGPCQVETLCPGVEPGGGRVLACLREHKRRLSTSCKLAVADFVLNRAGHGEGASPGRDAGPGASEGPLPKRGAPQGRDEERGPQGSYEGQGPYGGQGAYDGRDAGPGAADRGPPDVRGDAEQGADMDDPDLAPRAPR